MDQDFENARDNPLRGLGLLIVMGGVVAFDLYALGYFLQVCWK